MILMMKMNQQYTKDIRYLKLVFLKTDTVIIQQDKKDVNRGIKLN